MKTPFATSEHYRPTHWVTHAGVELAAEFGDAADEFRVARESLAIIDRTDRALLVLTGKDRQSWLHNVVTNDVRKLTDGAGCYAFACDVKGRVLFDLNVIALADRLWVDVPADRRDAVAAYFDRYVITEDVKIAKTDAFLRLGIVGPRSFEVAAALGSAEPQALPPVAHREINGSSAQPGAGRLVRHDFAGVPGFELVVNGSAAAWWDFLLERHGARPVGITALDALRIEAGIPWYGRDIDEKTIAPETAQAHRAISYNKGCYLGQEIIERMRSLGTPARRLVRLRLIDGADLGLPVALRQNDADAGRITSLALHPLDGDWIGLGYLRTAIKNVDGITAGTPPRAVQIIE